MPASLVSLMRITTVAATGLFSRFLRRAGQPPSSARIEKAPLNKHSAELVILPRRGLVESVASLSLTSTGGIIAVVFCSNCFSLHASPGIIITHKQSGEGFPFVTGLKR